MLEMMVKKREREETSMETLRVRAMMMTWTVSVSSWTEHVTDSREPEVPILTTAARPAPMTPASLKRLAPMEVSVVVAEPEPSDLTARCRVNTAWCLTPAPRGHMTIKYLVSGVARPDPCW